MRKRQVALPNLLVYQELVLALSVEGVAILGLRSVEVVRSVVVVLSFVAAPLGLFLLRRELGLVVVFKGERNVGSI